jgi:hypothetical protein
MNVSITISTLPSPSLRLTKKRKQQQHEEAETRKTSFRRIVVRGLTRIIKLRQEISLSTHTQLRSEKKVERCDEFKHTHGNKNTHTRGSGFINFHKFPTPSTARVSKSFFLSRKLIPLYNFCRLRSRAASLNPRNYSPSRRRNERRRHNMKAL